MTRRSPPHSGHGSVSAGPRSVTAQSQRGSAGLPGMHTILSPEARVALQAVQQLLVADDRPRATLGEVIDWYEAEHLAVDGLSPYTLKRIRLSLRRLAPWRTREIAGSWRSVAVDLYRQHGEIPGSVVTSTLARLLHLARKRGLRLDDHDLAGLSRIRSKPRTAIVAAEHRATFLAELLNESLAWRVRAAECAAFLVWTGMRVAEACNIERDHVSLAERFVMLPRTKNGKARCVPCCDEAMEILRPLVTRSRYVMRRVTADLPLNPRQVLHVTADAAKRAGIPHVYPHKLRHTFATEAKILGLDDRTIAGVLGNTPEELRRTYQHVATPDAIDAMRAIANAYAKAGAR